MDNNQEPIEIQIPVPWGYIAGCLYESEKHRNKGFRPILASHGWQDNAGTFARLAPLLVSYAPILAIDLPGHGRSSHYPPGVFYNTPDYIGIIKYIKEYYKWPKVSLMAHSMGGVVNFLFASIFPNDVDMIIALDILSTRYFEPPIQFQIHRFVASNRSSALIRTMKAKRDSDDNELQTKTQTRPPAPPPLYSMAQLEELLHKGSNYSIDLENCKYILERSVTASPDQPDKYYFVRDNRLKYILEFSCPFDITMRFASEIKNINYLVIAADASELVNESNEPVANLLRDQCNHFELHKVPNTKHHLHLNNPEIVAEYVIPFLKKFYHNDASLEASSKL